MVVKLGKKKSNESKRVKLLMSFLDELKNIIVVEAKLSPSESKGVQGSPRESKRVKLRMSFLDDQKNIMVIEAKASPSES